MAVTLESEDDNIKVELETVSNSLTEITPMTEPIITQQRDRRFEVMHPSKAVGARLPGGELGWRLGRVEAREFPGLAPRANIKAPLRGWRADNPGPELIALDDLAQALAVVFEPAVEDHDVGRDAEVLDT